MVFAFLSWPVYLCSPWSCSLSPLFGFVFVLLCLNKYCMPVGSLWIIREEKIIFLLCYTFPHLISTNISLISCKLSVLKSLARVRAFTGTTNPSGVTHAH